MRADPKVPSANHVRLFRTSRASLARSHTEEAIATLITIARNEGAPDAVRVRGCGGALQPRRTAARRFNPARDRYHPNRSPEFEEEIIEEMRRRGLFAVFAVETKPDSSGAETETVVALAQKEALARQEHDRMDWGGMLKVRKAARRPWASPSPVYGPSSASVARNYAEEVIRTVVKMTRRKSASPTARVKAAKKLLSRAWGPSPSHPSRSLGHARRVLCRPKKRSRRRSSDADWTTSTSGSTRKLSASVTRLRSTLETDESIASE